MAAPPIILQDPGRECEVYVSGIPPEEQLTWFISKFEKAGPIFSLRYVRKIRGALGFAFIRYFNKADARKAILKFDGCEMIYKISVCLSVANPQLLLFNLGNQFSSDELLEEIKRYTQGLVNVKIMRSSGKAILSYSRGDYAESAKHAFRNGQTLCGQKVSVVWHTPVLVESDYPIPPPPGDPYPPYYIDNYVFGIKHPCVLHTIQQTDRYLIDDISLQPTNVPLNHPLDARP